MNGKRIIKINIICIILLLTYISGILILKDKPLEIEIVYSSAQDNEDAKLYYGINNDWEESHSISSPIENKKAEFLIPIKLYNKIVTFRLEPCGSQSDIVVEEFRFYRSGFLIKKIIGADIRDYLIENQNCSLEVEGDGLRIKNNGDIPQLFFFNEFSLFTAGSFVYWSCLFIVMVLAILLLYLWSISSFQTAVKLRKFVKRGISIRRLSIMSVIGFNLLLSIFMAFLCFFFYKYNTNLKKTVMCINYEETLAEKDAAEVFYDMGEGFNQGNSSKADIHDNTAYLELNVQVDDIIALRLDPIQRVQTCSIESIDLAVGAKKFFSISGKELDKYIQNIYNAEYREIRGKNLIILSQNEDLAIELSSQFVNDIRNAALIKNKHDTTICVIVCLFSIGIINLIRKAFIIITKRYKRIRVVDITERIINFITNKRYREIIVVILLFTIPIVILFAGYLSGSKYWIFTGIASDSYGQLYPNYYNFTRRIAEGYNVAGWDFINGLGSAVSKGVPDVNGWILFFGESRIEYLIGISYVLKLFLSGLIFFKYLRLIGREKVTSIIGGLSYAFCGHMIIRGRWENMPREVLLVAILLLSFELYFMKRDIRWLPIAIILFTNNMSDYALVLYGVVFSGYAVFRYFLERKFERKDFIRFILGLFFCIVIALPFIMQKAEGVLNSINSDRFASGVADYSSVIEEKREWFIDWDNIQSAFFRTIGIDIIGSENKEFTGALNVLEDPTFYCGIATILAIPLAWERKNKKKNYWYLTALIIASVYFFINPIRQLVGGMAGTSTFKISSFWVIILFLYIGSDGLDNLWSNSAEIKKVKMTAAIFIAAGLLFAIFVNNDIKWERLVKSYLFIIVLSIIFIYYTKTTDSSNKRMLKILSVSICMCEIILFTYSYINPNTSLKNDGARTGLNDYSIEALAYIDKRDDGVFRIDKQYQSYGNCDTLYQNYMGTKSYIGGLGNNENVVAFYDSLGLPKIGGSSLLGSSVYDEVNTLLGVKYVLSKSSNLFNYGYSYVDKINDIYIYENQYALPLVYGYNKYISRQDFEKLSINDKRSTLLEYCVIDDEENGERKNLTYYEDMEDFDREILKKYSVDWTQEESRVLFEENKESNSIVVRVKTDNKTEDVTYGYVRFISDNSSSGNIEIGTPQGENELMIVINQEGANELNFLMGDIETEVISVSQIPQEIYYEHYRECISGLNAINAEDIVIDKKNSSISGKVSIKEPTELCFSIPFDKSWKLMVNGKEAEVEKLNIGFIGSYLEKGEYDFELRYAVNDNSRVNIIETISYTVALANFIIFCFIYWKRKRQHEG